MVVPGSAAFDVQAVDDCLDADDAHELVVCVVEKQPDYTVMAYIVMAYRLMAYRVMAMSCSLRSRKTA